MSKNAGFENFLSKKNDSVDNAAFALACAIASKKPSYDGSELEWNMSLIGEIADFTEEVLTAFGVSFCRPYYEGDNETPCYLGTDCKVPDCPLRAERSCKKHDPKGFRADHQSP